MPKPSEYQEKVRHGNRMSVLSLLEDQPMRFSELQNASGMSPRGLDKVLKDLDGDNLITRALKGRWSAYAITKKGISTVLNTMTIGIFSDQIEKDNGKYFHDYTKTRSFFESKGRAWGIKDDVVIEKSLEKAIAPILKNIIKNTQKNIIDIFLNGPETKDRGIDKLIDKLIDKKIVIGFTIDFNSLLKSIKESSFLMLQEVLNDKSKKSNRKNTSRRVK